jgi:hypothetical protein
LIQVLLDMDRRIMPAPDALVDYISKHFSFTESILLFMENNMIVISRVFAMVGLSGRNDGSTMDRQPHCRGHDPAEEFSAESSAAATLSNCAKKVLDHV